MKTYCQFAINAVLSGLLLSPGVTRPRPGGFSEKVLQGTSLDKKLFDSDDLLTIVLKGDVRATFRDRSSKPKDHSLILSYFKEDSSEMSIPVQVKTRGHFRKMRENCFYPPLLLQFSKDGAAKGTIFDEQSKLKLVMPCKGDDYVVREWLAYKIYNMVTPKSFLARLVKVQLKDDKNRSFGRPFFGMLIEEEEQMAKRNQCIPVKLKIKGQQTLPDYFLGMAVFEYLIGNTDWSVEYRQNIKLLKGDSSSVPVAVPYDFDHAGIVNAPYARPDEQPQMSSVRERRYRGYCVGDMKAFYDVIVQFNRIKKDIYSLYTACDLLDAKYIRSTIQYLDDFYLTINDPKLWQKEFAYACDKGGAGNVIIKGMKND